MIYNSPQRLANTYQTIFQVFFQAAAPAGYAISYVIVGDMVMFFIVFACVSFAGTFVLCTLRPPISHPSIPACKKENISLRAAISPVQAFFLHDRRSRYICAYGIFMSVWFAGLPACVFPMFAVSTSHVAILLFFYGIGNFVASFLFGSLANRFGRLVCMLVGAGTSLAGFVLFICSGCGRGTCHSEVAVLASFLVGLGNAINFANFSACIVASVHDATHAGFAAKLIYESLCNVLVFLVLPNLSYGWAIATCISVLVFCVSYLAMQKSFFMTLELDHGSENVIVVEENIFEPFAFNTGAEAVINQSCCAEANVILIEAESATIVSL